MNLASAARFKNRFKNHFRFRRLALGVVIVILLLVGVGYYYVNVVSETKLSPDRQAKLDTETAWLKQHMLPLYSDAPTFPLTDDLDQLMPVLQRARVIGLGEATHGTKEFYQMKDRLFRYLVEHNNVRAFSIEYHFADAVIIDDYIVHGTGSAEAAVQGIEYWTYRTAEVLELVKWMRAWNVEHPDDLVRFYGFDMQGYYPVLRALRAYDAQLGNLNRAPLEMLAQQLGQVYVPDQNTEPGVFTPELQAAVADQLGQLRANYTSQQEQIVSILGEDSYALLIQHVRVLEQAIEQMKFNFGPKKVSFEQLNAQRDGFMAENARWMLDRVAADQKVVVWAHNGHVAKQDGWMGGYLKQALGDAYYVIGFEFYHGHFKARDSGDSTLRDFVIDYNDNTTLYGRLGHLGKPYLFLDFSQLDRAAPENAWIFAPLGYHDIGALYSTNKIKAIRSGRLGGVGVLPEIFDGLVYIHTSTGAEILPYQPYQ